MAKEDNTAEYIRRVRQQLAGVSHGEGMRRLEVERQNVDDRFSARALDELIHEEKTKFRKRILIRLGGWAVVLGVIFFVLIYFGGSGGSSKPAAKPAPATKTTKTVLKVDTKSKPKSKQSGAKSKQANRSTDLSSASTSSTKAASSSKKAAQSSRQSVKAASSSKTTVASSSSRQTVQSSRPAAASKPAATQAPVRRTQPQQPVRPSTYTVKRGDNLYRIGVNHGLTLKEIQALNGMGNSHNIQPGEVLRVR